MEVHEPCFTDELFGQSAPCSGSADKEEESGSAADKDEESISVLSIQNTDASSLCLEATLPQELTVDET